MWQADNDRYALLQLEQQLLPKRIDRLINSVTTADRTPMHTLPAVRRLTAAFRRWVSAIYSPVPASPLVRRAAE